MVCFGKGLQKWAAFVLSRVWVGKELRGSSISHVQQHTPQKERLNQRSASTLIDQDKGKPFLTFMTCENHPLIYVVNSEIKQNYSLLLYIPLPPASAPLPFSAFNFL